MSHEEIIYRLPLAEIHRQAAMRTPGYEAAMLAAGRRDADGIHLTITLADRRRIWQEHGAPGLDLEIRGGCAGCGG